MPTDPDPQGGTALLTYVMGSTTYTAEPGDTEFANAKYAEAFAIVTQYVGQAPVPPIVLHEAVLEVGSKLWERRAQPTARDGFDMTGPPAMAPKDPMVTVYPVLDRWVLRGLG